MEELLLQGHWGRKSAWSIGVNTLDKFFLSVLFENEIECSQFFKSKSFLLSTLTVTDNYLKAEISGKIINVRANMGSTIIR